MGEVLFYILMRESPVRGSWPQLITGIDITLLIRLVANWPKQSAMLGFFKPTCASIMKLLAGYRLSCQVLSDFPQPASRTRKSR